MLYNSGAHSKQHTKRKTEKLWGTDTLEMDDRQAEGMRRRSIAYIHFFVIPEFRVGCFVMDPAKMCPPAEYLPTPESRFFFSLSLSLDVHVLRGKHSSMHEINTFHLRVLWFKGSAGWRARFFLLKKLIMLSKLLPRNYQFRYYYSIKLIIRIITAINH